MTKKQSLQYSLRDSLAAQIFANLIHVSDTEGDTRGKIERAYKMADAFLASAAQAQT